MAIILRNVTAEVVDLDFEKFPPENPHRLIVRGQILKQIIYGAQQGMVHYQDAIDPFEVMIDLPDLTSASGIDIRAEIEHISPRLLDDGIQVDQQIILKVYVDTDNSLSDQVQNFLVRSINHLQEIESLSDPEEEKTEPAEPKREFKKVKVKARAKPPEPKPKIIPIPDVSLIINEKIEELEELLHEELEDSLRSKLHSELENSLRTKIQHEVINSVQHRLRNELEDSIYQRLHREFEAQLERKLTEERQRIKQELQQEHKEERLKYHDQIRQKSIQQQRNGYRVKG